MTADPAPGALLDAALGMHAAGLCVLPAADDGSKRPAVPWREYQHTRPDTAQLTTWFGDGRRHGLGIICGAISGHLELSEIEGRAVDNGALVELTELAANSGLTGLWQKVIGGWSVRSPSGGLHLLYRLDGPVPGNTKLAATPDHVTLAETRGEGGWVVTAPSTGPVHPSGGTWATLAGGPATIPMLTADERRALHVLLAQLDQRPVAAPPSQFAAHTGGTGDGGISPGDDYSAKTSWPEVLEPAGWRQAFTRGQVTYWRRPGKNDGISATTGYGDGDWLYIFTSSTAFEPERTYTKLGAYAVLHHGGDHQSAAKALQGKGYGKRPKERPLSLVHGGGADQPTVDGTAALKLDQPGSDLPTQVVTSLTDHGNAQLLTALHGHRLRYVPSRGQWLTWTGQRWAWCEDDGEIIQAATDAVQSIQPADDYERKHQQRSLSRRSLEAAAALARRDPRLRVSAADLDADPYALNTPAGAVDLRTGALTPSTPDQLHTRITGVPYQPTAQAPRWRQFLADTFNGDDDVAGFVQRLAGYSAAGIVTHHVLPFLHGAGGNGKSVFLDVLIAALGDYASTAPSDFLMSGGRDDDNAVARLSGLRLVVCSEVEQSARFNEAKIKVLTGGDRLTARFLYQRHFTFTPTHTLWLMANHQPQVDAGGESFWRRLRLLPFTTVVPKEKRVEGLARELIDAEGPGILTWIVDGARQALAGGLREPASVLQATAQYAEEEDALARFVAERCNVGGGHLVRTATRDMRAAYEQWCRDEGQRHISPQVFGRELRTRYSIGDTRSNGRRYYTGVTLLEPEDGDPGLPAGHWSDR